VRSGGRIGRELEDVLDVSCSVMPSWRDANCFSQARSRYLDKMIFIPAIWLMRWLFFASWIHYKWMRLVLLAVDTL
jgi:hypothetical protein